MTEREAFFKIVQKEIFDKPDIYVENYEEDFNSAYLYYLKLKNDSVILTEFGKKILSFMQQNQKTYNNSFKAKDIGDKLGYSGHKISGAIRKLFNDNLVSKTGQNPVIYSLTQNGIDFTL